MANPVASHTFDFNRTYLSTRTGGAAGSGVWTSPTTIFDISLYAPHRRAETFSAGALGPTDPNNGIIMQAHSVTLLFLGNGLPDVPVEISVNPEGFILGSDYWNTTQGAWTSLAGHSYILYQAASGGIKIAKSTDLWVTPGAVQNGAAAPSTFTSFPPAALQRVDDTISVMASDDGANFHIYEFDMGTDLWSAAFAPLTIASFADFTSATLAGQWTNGLFKFPNGDYLVIYEKSDIGTYAVLRLWSALAGTWGSEVLLPGSLFGSGGSLFANAVMDSGLEQVHILTYDTNAGNGAAINYSLYDHDSDTLTANVTQIPAAVTGADGVGHCSIQNSMLFVPRDDQADLDNAVWVADLPVTAFLKELLPVPASETNVIKLYSINPVAGGYLAGDTFTVDGGIDLATGTIDAVRANGIATFSSGALGTGYAVGNTLTIDGGSTLAAAQVTSVNGSGGITGLFFTELGAGYSVAAGVSTTATSGVGSGFTLNILSIFTGVSSVTITLGGSGYSIANNVATTATSGVGVGLTVNILSLTGKKPSCAYMMFPNGYSLTIPGPALTCPIGGGTATVGVPYSAFLIATGGTPPYTYSIASGALPPGLSLNAATGEISGTPTSAGVYTYTARVTDANGLTADTSPGCTINVSAGTLAATCPPSAHFSVGTPYSAQVGFSGGVPPYTFAIIAGSLPPGVTLNASTGLISGTPTVGGDYNYTVQVTDSLGNTANTASCPLDLCTGVKSELTPPAPVAMAGDICDQSVRSSPKSLL